MKQVKCKSGIKGWREQLQKTYNGFEEWESYSEMYGLHKRLGYKNALDAWNDNPMVESSTIPSDYRKV